MERLVTTAQAAQILGLSLQGVHYRIKHNQLKSLKKSGKTYVYISDHVETKEEPRVEIQENPNETLREVIEVKNEQIVLLKKNIKWMKRQYTSEISRLEKNQKRIIGVFNREIELLQSAFNEMRSVYKQPQIAQVETEEKFISLQEFSLYLKKNNKNEKEIKLIILKAIKTRDSRFIYNKKDKKLLILNSDFSDLI
ncbi:DNA-binding protein [Arcobacter sp. LA11]|uniref:DNA-binding protein n=1 Tax=Arcobacter sp. LA11 TaxID=1898176 RepID=UPI00093551E0|nr:DNA-binding protein [Arcobacter sp. LA11]